MSSKASSEPWARPPSAGAATEDHSGSTSSGAGLSAASRSVLDWALLALPPTTVLSALALWFGYALTRSRNDYYGLDVSTLGFSTTDYVLRSIDAVIVPAMVLAVVLLVLLGLHCLIRPVISAHPRARPLRAGLLLLVVAGVAATGVGVRGAFVPLFGEAYLASPILLGAGSLCAAYGIRMLRTLRRRPDRAAGTAPRPVGPALVQVCFAVLVVVALFWGATRYADALGRGRAMAVEEHLTSRPAVILYSKTALGLAPPVEEVRTDGAASEYGFRYTNLRLLIRSNGKYFLFPEQWTHQKGRIILIEDDASIRVEFQPGEHR